MKQLETGLLDTAQNSNLCQNECLNAWFQVVKNGTKEDLNN